MIEDTSRRSVIKSAGIVGATVLGGAATTDVVAAQYDDVSWPVSVYDYVFDECCTSHDPERYRSIAQLDVDWYISWDSGGYFNHRPTISGTLESNRQDGRDSRGDPEWVKFGGIRKAALDFDNKSDWHAPLDEGRWLQFCPAVEGKDDGYEVNPFAKWLIADMILGNTPGISVLKDLYDGSNALLQTAKDDNFGGYTTWERTYDAHTEGQLRLEGGSCPYAATQTFRPLNSINYDGGNARASAMEVITRFGHKGGAGVDDPLAGADIEVPTPNKRFEEMSESERDRWGVKPTGESRFPLDGTNDDDLIATDVPADLTRRYS